MDMYTVIGIIGAVIIGAASIGVIYFENFGKPKEDGDEKKGEKTQE